jgi:sugar transferase (PEP-CTERM/EpsH1 system associated)
VKILFVCHRFPFPPKRGGKIRPFNVIRHLTSLGHEVTVASHYRSAAEEAEGAGLADHCAKFLGEQVGPNMARVRMVANLATTTPSSMGYFYSPRLHRRIKDELATGTYDLIFVHCSSVAQYVADATGPRKILDFGDMDSQKWLAYSKIKPFPLSAGYWLEGTKMRRAEEQLAKQFDLCTCTTRMEWETLDEFGTGVPTDWFPNGVDLDKFAPTGEAYDRDTICFVGRMDYYPNIECVHDFVANTLPLLVERRPSIKLTIVGADPEPSIRALASDNIVVTGSVPEVQPYVRAAALTVAPLNIARGTQNKILESLAMGVPCVCSELAAGGVDCVAGEHILTASTPAEYADQILRLLDDPEERRRFSEAGRTRMETNHAWDKSMAKLDGIIEKCMAATAVGT